MATFLKEMDFGNEAGDDADPIELATYFVEQDVFKKFLKPTDNSTLLKNAMNGRHLNNSNKCRQHFVRKQRAARGQPQELFVEFD